MSEEKRAALRSYLQFLIVGAGAFAIDAGVYVLLTRPVAMHYLAARTISLLLTFVWSYTANRYWTFKAHTVSTRRSLVRFAVVNGGAIALNLIGMRVAVGVFQVHDLIALVVLTMGISVLSYVSHKRWSFQEG